MKTTRSKLQFDKLPRDYIGLCRLHMPRPIKDKVDFENVTRMTDAMAGHNFTPDQDDYFDLLCRLIETYEDEQERLDTPNVSGLDALRHLLEEHRMGAADLSRLLDVHRSLGAM